MNAGCRHAAPEELYRKRLSGPGYIYIPLATINLVKMPKGDSPPDAQTPLVV